MSRIIEHSLDYDLFNMAVALNKSSWNFSDEFKLEDALIGVDVGHIRYSNQLRIIVGNVRDIEYDEDKHIVELTRLVDIAKLLIALPNYECYSQHEGISPTTIGWVELK